MKANLLTRGALLEERSPIDARGLEMRAELLREVLPFPVDARAVFVYEQIGRGASPVADWVLAAGRVSR